MGGFSFSDLGDFDPTSDSTVSDVTYTGLDDTAESYSGSSTLSTPIAGSSLQLSSGFSGLNIGQSDSTLGGTLTAPQNEQELVAGSNPGNYSGLNTVSTGNSLEQGASFSPSTAPKQTTTYQSQAVSATTDPGFYGSDIGAYDVEDSMDSMLGSLGKLGAGFAQLISGSAPSTTTVVESAPSTVSSPVSGTNVVLILIVVGTLILLLVRDGE